MAGSALSKDHASPHSENFSGKPALAAIDINRAIITPVRPAGGAWSNVKDEWKNSAHSASLRSGGYARSGMTNSSTNVPDQRQIPSFYFFGQAVRTCQT